MKSWLKNDSGYDKITVASGWEIGHTYIPILTFFHLHSTLVNFVEKFVIPKNFNSNLQNSSSITPTPQSIVKKIVLPAILSKLKRFCTYPNFK